MSLWNDFEDNPSRQRRPGREGKIVGPVLDEEAKVSDTEDQRACDWGLNKGGTNTATDGGDSDNADCDPSQTRVSKFIAVYEIYLQDKRSFIGKQTPNAKLYEQNPQKALRDWFANELESEELDVKTEKPSEGKYICKLELPIEDHEFTIASDVCGRQKEATFEVCLSACKLLDESGLLLDSSGMNGVENNEIDTTDRKRRIDAANKEDDIEYDETLNWQRVKRQHCDTSSSKATSKEDRTSSGGAKVNTYESLLARWNEINMNIVRLKAKLVKLDLSVVKAAGDSRGTATKGLRSDESAAFVVARDDDVDDKDSKRDRVHGIRNESRESLRERVYGGSLLVGKSEAHKNNSRPDEREQRGEEVDGGGDDEEGEEAEEDEDEEEEDPLDAYMSTLQASTAKTKLSMDEKIEKSRIRSEISAQEREQAELGRLIELARPKFSLEKALLGSSASAPASAATKVNR